MTKQIRVFTDEGNAKYQEWLTAAKTDVPIPTPSSLLVDRTFSTEFIPTIAIEREPMGRPFESRYEFGRYLCDRLSSAGKLEISRNAKLWNWLSLFYIDQLAPPDERGVRTLVDTEVYFLASTFKYDSYYRHAVRTAWLAVQQHGEHSKVMLVPAGKPKPGTGILAHRGELIEQLAGRQQILGSKTIIECAARLYMDPSTLRPRHGAGGSGQGSPRRFGLVLQQLDLTYDLASCSAEKLLNLLPREFDRWKVPTLSSRRPRRRSLLEQFGFATRPSA